MSEEEFRGKRPAPRIDQKTLQYVEQGDQDKKNKEKQSKTQQKANSSENSQVRERQFFKISKGNTQNIEHGKPNFKLFHSQQKAKINDVDTSQTKKDDQSDNKIEKKNGHTKEAGDKDDDKDGNKTKQLNGGIFANNNGAGIFSGSLFGGISNNNIFASKMSIFGNINEKDEAKSENKGLGLKINSEGGLSGIFQSGKSIFNFQHQVPPESKNKTGTIFGGDGEDDQQDSAQLQKLQKLDCDRSKSTGTYNYESKNTTIFAKPVKKFKKNVNNLVEGVQIQILQDQNKNKSWVIAKLVATKHPIMTGFLIKGLSTVKNINNKDENVQVALACAKQNSNQKSVKDGQQKSALQKVLIKIQFEEAADGKTFLEEIKKLI